MSLLWTKTIPTKAGWYWEWNFGYKRVVEVYTWHYFPKENDPSYRKGWESEDLWVTYHHTRDHPMPVGQAFGKDTMWAGPIEEPEKP